MYLEFSILTFGNQRGLMHGGIHRPTVSWHDEEGKFRQAEIIFGTREWKFPDTPDEFKKCLCTWLGPSHECFSSLPKHLSSIRPNLQPVPLEYFLKLYPVLPDGHYIFRFRISPKSIHHQP